MSVLTMVRHGQAAYMEADYDKLSPLGEQQAFKLGEFWVRHNIRFDHVFHGPAKRHIRTMEIAGDVLKQAGMPWPDPELLPSLDEFDAFTVMRRLVPVMIERDETIRRLNDEFRAQQESPEAGRLLQKLFEAVARRWSTGEFDVPDVESYSQFLRRVSGAVHRIRTSNGRSSQTVVFTSAGPIAATLATALELPPLKAIEFVWMSRNSSYSQFLFSGDRFTMHSFNSIPHLDDLSLLTYR
jgi:broad specificity phosphatase PhoE